jgi:hypothetical protein
MKRNVRKKKNLCDAKSYGNFYFSWMGTQKYAEYFENDNEQLYLTRVTYMLT